jgi:ATP dependent DNA ligase domain
LGWGGEGVVLKEPTSIYRPGMRSPAWLKVKPKVTLDVVVTGGSSEPIQWGDWRLAVMLDIAYTHPRDGKLVEIRQTIRIRRDDAFRLHAGERAELVCWSVMSSGMLKHPLFVRWLA